MHSGGLPVLRIDLAPSRGWASIIGIFHALTLAVFALSGAPASVVAAGAVVIAAHAIYRMRRDALLLTPLAVVALELAAGQVCTLVTRNGSRIDGQVGEATRVTGRLVVVGVRARPWHRSRTIAIVPGMAPSETLRELRVRLRWDTAPVT